MKAISHSFIVVVAAMVLLIASSQMAKAEVKMQITIDDAGNVKVYKVEPIEGTSNLKYTEMVGNEIQQPSDQIIHKNKNIYSVIPCTIVKTNPCIYYYIRGVEYEYCY